MNDCQFDVSNQTKEAVWQAFYDGKPFRVPMMLDTNPRIYLLDPRLNKKSITFEQYFNDPATMIEVQLQYDLHVAQHINCYCDSPRGLPDYWTVYVDDQNVGASAFLGAPIVFLEGQVPDVRARYTGDNKMAIFDVDTTRPLTHGFYAERLAFYARMVEIAERMTFMDRPIQVKPYSMYWSDGPLTVAMNVCGAEFMMDLILNPDHASKVMSFITESLIHAALAFRAYWHDWEIGELMQDDSIQLISTQMYRDVVLPFHHRYYDALAPDRPRKMHLCGDATRHFKLIHEELNVMEFDTGFPVDFTQLRKDLGPDVLIYGGVEVALLLYGTPTQVYERTKEILLSGIKDGGRFVLRDANNLPPAAPAENLAAMYQACLDYGGYDDA